MSRHNMIFPSTIPVTNVTVVTSLKYPLYITQYFSSARPDCCILVLFSTELKAFKYLKIPQGRIKVRIERLEKLSG